MKVQYVTWIQSIQVLLIREKSWGENIIGSFLSSTVEPTPSETNTDRPPIIILNICYNPYWKPVYTPPYLWSSTWLWACVGYLLIPKCATLFKSVYRLVSTEKVHVFLISMHNLLSAHRMWASASCMHHIVLQWQSYLWGHQLYCIL